MTLQVLAVTHRLACLVPMMVLVIAVGCDDGRKALINGLTAKTAARNAQVEHAFQNALMSSPSAEVQSWRAFLKRWPSAFQHHGYAWYEEKQQFRGNVAATAVLEDLYVLKIILDFEIAPDFQKVGFPRLRFHFAEVKKVVLPPGGAAEGGASISFQPDQKWFGLDEWKRLEDSGLELFHFGHQRNHQRTGSEHPKRSLTPLTRETVIKGNEMERTRTRKSHLPREQSTSSHVKSVFSLQSCCVSIQS